MISNLRAISGVLVSGDRLTNGNIDHTVRRVRTPSMKFILLVSRFASTTKENKHLTMPRILKLFHAKANTQTAKKKINLRPSKGGIFRKKDASTEYNEDNILPKTEIKRSAFPVPIEQSITWTLSDDSVSVADLPSSQLSQMPQEKDERFDQRIEKPIFLFTEEDLIQNELNHIQALSKLEANVNSLKMTTEDLVARHAAEIDKKDDEYVELLIKLGEKEDELVIVQDELKKTKQELSVVSSKLIQTQHRCVELSEKGLFSSLLTS